MKNKWKLILFVGLLLLVASSVFLSACSLLTGESASQVDSRITKLENELQANGEAIAKLQQQVQEQQRIVNALALASPSPVAPAAPPATIAPATPPVPARFVLDKLTITPTEATTGQVVTMSIEVSNAGGIEGNYKVVFLERRVPQFTPNLLEYADLVTLKPGETKTVTFTTTKDVPGTYAVEVGGKVGQYTVIDETAPPTS